MKLHVRVSSSCKFQFTHGSVLSMVQMLTLHIKILCKCINTINFFFVLVICRKCGQIKWKSSNKDLNEEDSNSKYHKNMNTEKRTHIHERTYLYRTVSISWCQIAKCCSSFLNIGPCCNSSLSVCLLVRNICILFFVFFFRQFDWFDEQAIWCVQCVF